MLTLILPTLFSVLTNGLVIHENVAFHKVNDISLTRSKWLTTFVIDLNPFQHFLEKLSFNLQRSSTAANNVEKLYDYPSQHDYHHILLGLQKEITSLREQQERV